MNSKITVLAALSLGCLATALGLVGCGPKTSSDQALATDIQAKLYNDPTAKSVNVKVAVTDGVATLTGDAPSSDVALQIVNIANSTAGIKRVDNQMKVDTGTAAVAPAPDSANPPASNPPPEPAQLTASAPPQAPPAPVAERRDAPATVTLSAGTPIRIRMIDAIDSRTNSAGDTFRASLDGPITTRNGRIIIPSGAPVTVLLTDAKGAGRMAGHSELAVRLIRIEDRGRRYEVASSVFEEQGKGRGKQTAVRTGIGAAAGAVIGAIAGGGKGAAIGSLAGGGAGAGYQLATHGQQVRIASEERLTFRLEAPLTINVR